MTKMVQPYEGQVVHFDPTRNFGFIAEIGSTIKKFFFHTSRIINCECAIQDIEIGMLAKFDISPVPPRVGNLPYAVNMSLHKAVPKAANISAPSLADLINEVAK